MSLIVEASSPAAAEAAARSLRLEGFLARAVCRGRSSLGDRDLPQLTIASSFWHGSSARTPGSRPIAAA
jgi:hypothetical protein